MLDILPKDMVWLILKYHLAHLVERMHLKDKLHTISFYPHRGFHNKTKFEKTHCERNFRNWIYETPPFFVDWLYPLRLICKRINCLLKEKITYNSTRRLVVAL
jgi:hypothetical protein